MLGVTQEQPTMLLVHMIADCATAFTTAEWEETGGAGRVNINDLLHPVVGNGRGWLEELERGFVDANGMQRGGGRGGRGGRGLQDRGAGGGGQRVGNAGRGRSAGGRGCAHSHGCCNLVGPLAPRHREDSRSPERAEEAHRETLALLKELRGHYLTEKTIALLKEPKGQYFQCLVMKRPMSLCLMRSLIQTYTQLACLSCHKDQKEL